MGVASQSAVPESGRAPVELDGHEVGSVWDLCLSAEYDRDLLVSGIAGWLGPPDGLKLLDCACGSGFPSLDLARLGYQITCTDGSDFMLERFRRKARAMGLPIEPRQARWEELGELFTAAFDVVLCRGCSLIYAGTWDTDADPDPLALVSAIENFVRCVRPGGRLYLDTTTEESLYGEYPQVEEHAPRVIEGHTVRWREQITADTHARVRHWQVDLCIDDRSVSFVRKSHYLPHEVFKAMLEGAGLQDVGQVNVPGERYAVFSGRRPAT